MARECGPGKWVDFYRDDRDYVSWSVTGLTDAAVATVELESDGTGHALTYDNVAETLVGYFAGPDFVSPGSAVVVPVTSHLEVHITDGGVHRTLDGGFIRLIP